MKGTLWQGPPDCLEYLINSSADDIVQCLHATVFHTATDGHGRYIDPIDETRLAADTTDITVALGLHQLYKECTHRPYGLSDTRFQIRDSSLSMWMLRIAGIVDDHPLKNTVMHANFRESYARLQAGETLDQDEAVQFRAEMKALRQDTLRKADVIVTTMTNAGTPALYDSLSNIVLMVVDEASRATEAMFWPLNGFYDVCPMILE